MEIGKGYGDWKKNHPKIWGGAVAGGDGGLSKTNYYCTLVAGFLFAKTLWKPLNFER